MKPTWTNLVLWPVPRDTMNVAQTHASKRLTLGAHPHFFALCHIKVSIGQGQYLEADSTCNMFAMCDN
ncbi:hypothetical protein ACLKA7_009837 [Drosophila subpalustris]